MKTDHIPVILSLVGRVWDWSEVQLHAVVVTVAYVCRTFKTGLSPVAWKRQDWTGL